MQKTLGVPLKKVYERHFASAWWISQSSRCYRGCDVLSTCKEGYSSAFAYAPRRENIHTP